jgi:flagellar hook-length control protein FliK
MSSLRIGHASRATGAPTAVGETSRAEPSGEGASFAVALGVASLAPKAAAMLLDGSTSDAHDGDAVPRKRTEERSKTDELAASNAAASLATPVALVAAAATPFVGAVSDGGDDFDAVPASGSSLAGNVLGSDPRPGARSGVADKPNMTPSYVVTPDTANATNRAATGVVHSAAASLISPGTQAQAISTDSGDDTDKAKSPPVAATAASVAVSRRSTPEEATTVPESAAKISSTGETTVLPAVVAGAPPTSDATVSSRVATDSIVPAPRHAPTLDEAAVGGASSDAQETATAGASAILPALAPLQPSAPRSGGALSLSALLPALSQHMPLASPGQPGAGDANDNTATGSEDRGRSALIGAGADAGNTTAAVADSINAMAAFGTAPTTAPANSVVGSTGSADIAAQVSDHLARLVSAGSGEMVMRLHPPELGDLTVRVAVSGRDVSAWFTSPEPQVQTAISNAMGQLQTDLGNAGYNLNGAWVGADASNARRQWANQPTVSPTSAPIGAAAVAAPATAASRPASEVNIYV